jgi:hypothetical protein
MAAKGSCRGIRGNKHRYPVPHIAGSEPHCGGRAVLAGALVASWIAIAGLRRIPLVALVI